MPTAQLSARSNFSGGFTVRNRQWPMLKRISSNTTSVRQSYRISNASMLTNRNGLKMQEAHGHCHCKDGMRALSPVLSCCRKPLLNVPFCSESDAGPLYLDKEDEEFALENLDDFNCSESGYTKLTSKDIPPIQSQPPNVKHELIMLSLPAMVSQALDPLALLMETAYIGRLGSLELASAGVSISIFNVISKMFNIPLLSVATSIVAEDIARSEKESAIGDHVQEGRTNGKPNSDAAERKQLSSVSTALLLAVGIGIFEASALFLASGVLLNLMGVALDSPMRVSAQRFLSLRAIGAPAVVVSLALQGVLRGFKDTKTPVFCLGVGNVAALFLFPLLVNYFGLGLVGAATATVVSQYIVSLLLIFYLSKRSVLLPPKLGDLQFGAYIKSGGFLIGRTLAVLITMTIGASMAARQGPTAMAAHQICLQVWLAVSLLTDALATSGQAMVASSSSRSDFKTVKEIAYFVLKIGFLCGAALAVILAISFGSLANLFTKDAAVLEVAKTGVLFVGASQPVNALAFIFDGLHYGVSDFSYSAYSMMLVGVISSVVLLYAPMVIGIRGVWLGLAIFMGLRTVAGFLRLLSKNGPWWFLHRDSSIREMNI